MKTRRTRVLSPYLNPVALRFDSASSNLINFGNARFVNLTETNFLLTMIAVVYLRSSVVQGVILAKNAQDGQGGPVLATTTTNALRCQFNRSVVNAVAESSNVIHANCWYCIMGTVDVADTQPRLYYCRYLSGESLQEVSYAGGATQGSGTSASTSAVTVGNNNAASPSAGFRGDIYRIGWFPTKLNPDQGTQWMHTGFAIGASPLLNCYLGYYGSINQLDESGYHNHGYRVGSISLSNGPTLIARPKKTYVILASHPLFKTKGLGTDPYRRIVA